MPVFLLVACQYGQPAQKQVADTIPAPTVIVEAEKKDPTPANVEYIYHLKGCINDKYGIIAQLVTNNNRLTGYYKYTKQDNWISLEGTLNADKLHLEHRVSAKDTFLLIEYFEGRLSETAITGAWRLMNKDQSHPFVMTPYHGTQLDADHLFITNSEYSEQDSSWHFSEIKVYDNKGLLTQTISDIDIKLIHNQLYLEDLNNDGYWDLLIADTLQPVVSPLARWIYQPSTKQFSRDTSKTKKTPGVFDFVEPDNKTKK